MVKSILLFTGVPLTNVYSIRSVITGRYWLIKNIKIAKCIYLNTCDVCMHLIKTEKDQMTESGKNTFKVHVLHMFVL